MRIVWALLVVGALAGCAAAMVRNPVPASLEGDVQVVGMGPTQVRFWGDQLPPNADALVKEKWAQTRAMRPLACWCSWSRAAGHEWRRLG